MSKARIIVVEDEGLVALQIQEGLISAGYDVPGIAASGNEAIKLIANTEPDLVLMDIHLKGTMDGIQTAMKVKEMFDTPVIYLTAYSDHATVERAKKTEPYGYLLKPVTERSLELAIEMTLQKAIQEKQLKSDTQWYTSIVNGMSQGILVISLKGIIKFINPYGESVIHIPYGKTVNRMYKDVFTLHTIDTKEDLEIPFDDIIIDNIFILNKTCILRTSDNKEISLNYSLIPLQNQNKNTIGIIFMFNPCTIKEHEKKFECVDEPVISPDPGPVKTTNWYSVGDFSVHWYRKTNDRGKEPYFNVMDLGGEYIGYYIFDVSCYGITSGLFAHNLNQFLKPDIEFGGLLTCATSHGTIDVVSPLSVIRELNNRFFFEENDNPFFTIIYGITHKKSGKSRIVRAGHPYPVFQDKDKHIILFKPEGGAVGMFSEIQAFEYEFTFDPGTRLYLYSKGIIDSSFADINKTSFMRLISFIEEYQQNSSQEFIIALENIERMWHKDFQKPDDISLIVLERD